MVASTYTYDVYGEPTLTGSMGNEFDFAGQQTDPSTGLQYLRARYYDPVSGTFVSRDPLAFLPGWTGSPFGYAAGSPCSANDPSGLSPRRDCLRLFEEIQRVLRELKDRFGDYVKKYRTHVSGRAGHLKSYRQFQNRLNNLLHSWDGGSSGNKPCGPPDGDGPVVSGARLLGEYDLGRRENWGSIGKAFGDISDILGWPRSGSVLDKLPDIDLPDISPPSGVWWTELPPWWWPGIKVPGEEGR